ncbi:MAG: membrane dipeptidase [Candidatus Bathyarchaeia archaeon]|jgi:membrane dipeptidase
MVKSKLYNGYKAFQYLESGKDYQWFKLAKETGRVPPYFVPLSKSEEERFERFVENNVVISVHEHPVIWPEDMSQGMEQQHMGRDFMAYEALSVSGLDCIFDHLMDGTAYITSYKGWKWNDVVHDIGIRLSDIHHQNMIVPVLRVQDIMNAKKNGKIGVVLCIESATPCENEVDRLDVLYGFGVRSMGICYSESNMLGGGMDETNQDLGLTDFGYDCIVRMNKLGMLIDVGHTSDCTALDTIESSKNPIYDSHSGPSAIANGHTKGDEVLHALAEHGGLMSVGGAGGGLSTQKHPIGSIESYMECVEYCIKLMGIDHVACGPDTLYGDHQGLYQYWFSRMLGHYERPGRKPSKQWPIPAGTEDPGYVKGLENPNEFINVARWMIKHGYSDTEIAKITGENAIKLLEKVWV